MERNTYSVSNEHQDNPYNRPSRTTRPDNNSYYSNSSDRQQDSMAYQQQPGNNFNGAGPDSHRSQNQPPPSQMQQQGYNPSLQYGNTPSQLTRGNPRDAHCDPRFYGDYNETEHDLSGILPPLKQLDLNSIPPDVLGHMLNTKRIDHVVAASNNMGPGNYQSQPPQYQRQEPPPNVPYPNHQSYNNQQDSAYNGQRGGGHGRGGHNQGQPRYTQPAQPEPQRGGYSSNSNTWNGPPSETRPSRGQHSQQRGDWNNSSNPQQTRGHQQNNYQPSHHQMSQHHQHNHQGSFQSGQPRGKSQFELSPAAKEFTPTRTVYYQQPSPVLQSAPNMTPAISSWSQEVDLIGGPKLEQLINGQVDDSESLAYDMETHCVLEAVTDTVSQLAVNPGDFDRASKAVVDVLRKHLHDPDTLGVVLLLIFEQSVCNSNFCYTGARLCQSFHRNNIAVTGPPEVTFKNQLLEKCQEEFQICLEQINQVEEMQMRARGLIMFLAELYLNFVVEKSGKSTKNMIFGLACTELMTKLAAVRPASIENVRSVFQTLKLIGWEIDNESRKEFRPEIEKLMKELHTVRTSPETEQRAVRMLDTLFEIRSKNWNKEMAESQGSQNSNSGNPPPINPYKGAQPHSGQFYELPEAVEDDDYCLTMDDEPLEVQRAYEEFLQMTGK